MESIDPDPQTSSDDYVVGDVIAQKYRLENFLGDGAQGSVWEAKNLALDARVALKIVHNDERDQGPILRLQKEARAAARLAHPAIVRVFDLGATANGDAFIVMELLEGRSLAERLAEDGRMSPTETVRLLLPIAEALFAAHARGIVHRDVKPGNVFLARSANAIQPKLLDFGIAMFRRDPSPSERITEAGALVGSPAYASPEQVRCQEDVDHHADIWGFAVVLYECITGEVPFQSEDYKELFRQVTQDPPRSFAKLGVADGDLWEIVGRGLAKSRAERWPSMHAFGCALAHWIHDRGFVDDAAGVLLAQRWLRQKSQSGPARRAPLSALLSLKPIRQRELPLPAVMARSGPPVAYETQAARPRLLKRSLGLASVAAAALVLGGWGVFAMTPRGVASGNDDGSWFAPAPAAIVPASTAAPLDSGLAAVEVRTATGELASRDAGIRPADAGVPTASGVPELPRPASSAAPAKPRATDLDLLNPY